MKISFAWKLQVFVGFVFFFGRGVFVKIIKLVVAAILVSCLSFTVYAIPLQLTISDPLGDHTGDADLISVDMFFDNGTGDYDIFYNADPANPFIGIFRLNVNLRNITLLGTPPRSPDFSDTLNDFNLAVATSQIQLAGTSLALTNWQLGDEIAYLLPGAGGFGTSGALDDPIGSWSIGSSMRTTFVTGNSVPEPATLTLMGLGLAGILYRRRGVVAA